MAKTIKIKEGNAIRIFVEKKRGKAKPMWFVEPPEMVRTEFNKIHEKGFWCSNKEAKLIEVINFITDLILAKRQE